MLSSSNKHGKQLATKSGSIRWTGSASLGGFLGMRPLSVGGEKAGAQETRHVVWGLELVAVLAASPRSGPGHTHGWPWTLRLCGRCVWRRRARLTARQGGSVQGVHPHLYQGLRLHDEHEVPLDDVGKTRQPSLSISGAHRTRAPMAVLGVLAPSAPAGVVVTTECSSLNDGIRES